MPGAEELFRQMIRDAVREGIAIGLERAGYPRPQPRLEVIQGGQSRSVPVRRRRPSEPA